MPTESICPVIGPGSETCAHVPGITVTASGNRDPTSSFLSKARMKKHPEGKRKSPLPHCPVSMVSGQELLLLSPKKSTGSAFMPAPHLHTCPEPLLGSVHQCVCVLSRVEFVATSWTVALQVPLSMEFSSQEYWNELPFPTPGDLPDPGIQYVSLVPPALAGGFFTNCATWEAPAPVSPWRKQWVAPPASKPSKIFVPSFPGSKKWSKLSETGYRRLT